MITLKDIEAAKWIEEDEKEGTVQEKVITGKLTSSEIPHRPGLFSVYVKNFNLSVQVYFGISEDLSNTEKTILESKFNLHLEKALQEKDNEIIFEFLFIPEEKLQFIENKIRRLLSKKIFKYKFFSDIKDRTKRKSKQTHCE